MSKEHSHPYFNRVYQLYDKTLFVVQSSYKMHAAFLSYVNGYIAKLFTCLVILLQVYFSCASVIVNVS